jgi:hypothetical protein
VYLIEVDNAQLLTSNTMEYTTFLVEEDDLHRLELLGQLPSRDISINVQYLPIYRFRKTRKNGQSTCPNGGLQWALVDTGDSADETIFILVEIVGCKDARGNRTGTSSKFLKCTN